MEKHLISTRLTNHATKIIERRSVYNNASELDFRTECTIHSSEAMISEINMLSLLPHISFWRHQSKDHNEITSIGNNFKQVEITLKVLISNNENIDPGNDSL